MKIFKVFSLSIIAGLLLSFAEKSVLDPYIEELRFDPNEIEMAIIEVAQHGDMLRQVRELAEATKSDFHEIVKDLPEQQQLGAMQLMRRPDILKSYAIPNLNETEIKYLFRNYPPDLGERAVKYHDQYLDQLIKLSALHSNMERDFEAIMMRYEPKTRKAMEYLVDFPQVMMLITEENLTTQKLRETHTAHPDRFVYLVDSISRAIAKQRDKDLQEWKDQMESNPQAMEEFKRSAGIYETHLEAKEAHNPTMMAKSQNQQQVTAQQQAYFQQYGTRRDPNKNSNVHVSVWVGFGFGYGAPYWAGSPGMYGGSYYWNPYHNPYWF